MFQWLWPIAIKASWRPPHSPLRGSSTYTAQNLLHIPHVLCPSLPLGFVCFTLDSSLSTSTLPKRLQRRANMSVDISFGEKVGNWLSQRYWWHHRDSKVSLGDNRMSTMGRLMSWITYFASLLMFTLYWAKADVPCSGDFPVACHWAPHASKAKFGSRFDWKNLSHCYVSKWVLPPQSLHRNVSSYLKFSSVSNIKH